MLGFMIGRDRDYVVKNIQNLVKAWMKKTEISYGKMSCNFAESDFDEDSMPWINLLAKQDDLHRDIEGSGTYGFATSSSQYRNETVELKGCLLDDFYLIAKEKGSISYYHKRSREAYPIYVMPARCKTDLQIVTLYRNDKLTGINVSGKIPSFLKGAVHNYQIADHVLSMIDAEDEKSLSSFKSIANSQGEFSFNVGLKSLQEFYYRVLPSLMANDCVVVDDKASKQIQEYLPPEPEFVFYCDLADGCLTMQIEVSYGDTKMILPDDSKIDGVQRDYQQEDRVMTLASKFFTVRKGKEYHTPLQYDEVIYRFLSEYITELSYYGEVQGSQAFNSLQIKPIPQFTMDVSLSLDSDLLDLEILTKDMSPEELLELLDSYHAKKKYHRLKSGDFIDLNDPDNMIMKMDETLGQLNLTMEDVVNGKGHLPLYRALYVNSLLEERQELVTKRDKTLSQLVRSFKTIKDSDFNVPASLENVIRPYQEIGCRWLNFLNQTRFGGILADEMGLGKTLQLLATLETRKNEGNLSGVSLVVCPASLVYNWLEEAKHFTPDLNVMAIAGTATERKRLIESMDQGQADIYVTSYDLLKRDITMYDKIAFDTIALDEAQYIKNQKTAVTKAIKVLKARHRIALTGTPIENRLSEMWSIFDFLMPGFLYSHDMFVKMFENPIVKQKNQTVSQQLQKMTSPFILRREKKEVLKELPEKMEEVRYSRMEEEQRKLYDAQVVNIKTQLLNGIENRDKIKIFAELTKLREICCDPSLLFDNYTGGSAKREAFIELVKNAIDGNHRMLVFSQFTSMLALLEEDLKKEKINYYKITGSTAKEDRLRLVNKFNEGDVPVFLISLKAGGTGLNLTGADIVIHYDPWWNVAVTNQATDRAHRIGQTKQVTVYKMIAKDTIEEKILDMQMMKKELADVFVNGSGESLTRMSAEELIALLS